MKQSFAFVFFVIVFSVSACSLNYRVSVEDAEERVPELTFTDAVFTRYENRRRTIDFSASQIEQYSDGSRIYASKIEFVIFNDHGEKETSGKCGLLSSNTRTGFYELFDNIEISDTEREMTLFATVLRWNEDTEQLIGSQTDDVTLKKNQTTISGKGFSASAISNTFSFSSDVSGIVITEEEDE